MKSFKFFIAMMSIITSFLIYSCFEDRIPPESNVLNYKDISKENLQDLLLNMESKMALVRRNKEVTQNRSNDKECFDPNNPGQNIYCDPTIFSKTYTVEYKGCPYLITMSFSWCIDLITNEWFISTGEITNLVSASFNISPECWQVYQEIAGLYYSGQNEALGDLIDNIHYTLEVGWEDQFIRQYLGVNENQTFFCDSSDPTIVIENYKGSCYQYCIWQDDDYHWEKIRCGFGCCKRSTSYCVDRETNQVISTTEVEQLEPCKWDQEPYDGCKGILTECRQVCSEIK